ncbi:MAG TPA: hypothetical protein VFP93_03910, partial [Gammaproteobacteria bacterium]|nr:hypothetical protein [Gammaproteobacteria bacterium]
TLFKFQDVDRIMKMLQEGKDLKIFDDLFNSPQELIKKGESIRDITVLIFKNAFKHKEKLMISPEHLHPNDRTYTHATIANMHPSLKNAFKNIFIQLLEKMPLGSTVLKLENEKKIYQKIIAFLNKQDRLFLTHLDRLDVAFQLIRMFRNPECLDQGYTHLCGVATFLQFLIEHTPLSCLEAMMDYCETGYTKNPNLIKYSGKFADDSLVFQSFIQAFKHTNSFYGYYPSYEPMEAITGATKSKSIAEWMEKAGFSDLEDTWALKNPQGQELPLLYRGILGGMYSKYHRQRTHEEQLSALLEAHEQGKAIALNISPLLANRKLFLSTEEEAYRKEMKTKSILGLVYSHWVNLKDIQFHAEEQLVHFKYYTYGKIYSGALPVQYFLKEIYGMVAGTPPTQLEPFIECSTSLSPPL